MRRAYADGSYRVLPWKGIASLGLALAYLVMPIDVIPDFILGFGFIDDGALFALALKLLGREIQKFREWEASKKS